MSQVTAVANSGDDYTANIFVQFNLEAAIKQVNEIAQETDFDRINGAEMSVETEFAVDSFGADYDLFEDDGILWEGRYSTENVEGLVSAAEYLSIPFKDGWIGVQVGKDYFRIVFIEGYGGEEYKTSMFPYQKEEYNHIGGRQRYISLMESTEFDEGASHMATVKVDQLTHERFKMAVENHFDLKLESFEVKGEAESLTDCIQACEIDVELKFLGEEEFRYITVSETWLY